MNPTNFRARRATVDDLPQLKALWQAMRLPTIELEKSLTDFQVLEGPDGKVAGALGFQMLQHYGRLHSEVFGDFSIADTARPLIWTRLQALCMNHGIFRIWTQEQSPFWSRNGFQPADEAALKKLPEPWKLMEGKWLTLKLKDEEAIASLEKEFAMYMAAEKQRSSEVLESARKLKTIVTILAFVFAFLILGAAAYVWFKRQALGH